MIYIFGDIVDVTCYLLILTITILMLSTLHSITLMMWYLMNKDCPDDLVDVVNLELDDFDDLDDVVDGQVQEHLVPVLVLLYRQGRESTSSFSGERIICSTRSF